MNRSHANPHRTTLKSCLPLITAATVLHCLFQLNLPDAQADVIHQIPPGPGEVNWSTPWKPANVEGTPAFVDFEGLAESQVLGELIPGVKFTTPQGQDWRVGRWSSGNYNGKYPSSGIYTSQGDAWAWPGESQGAGIIRFTQGKGTYFSCLASTFSGVTVDAYDENNNLVATGGWASGNLGAGTMDRITVVSAFRNIQYVIVHDSGNYWIIDCISTDAPGVGLELAVPSFKQYDSTWKTNEIVPGKTIGQIGCALTSVAMVLASYGFTTIDVGEPLAPDVKALNPGTVNTWLKKHNGYTAGGDIYWNKIDVLTGGQVVFGGGGGVNYQVVNTDLEFRQPVILSEPGHWVVARGKHTEDVADETKNYFLIRDPGHAIDSLNGPPYHRAWSGYRRYVPGSGVVRPALTIRMHSPAEVLVTDRDGRRTGFNPATGAAVNEIPDASSFEDGPINDLETGVIATPGQKVVYVPVADRGPYQITAVGTGVAGYELDVEWRDSASQYNTTVIEGTTAAGKIEQYRVVNPPVGAPAVISKGSLKGGGTVVNIRGDRAVVVANISCDGSTVNGTLRFEFPKTGRMALSGAIHTATFQNGAANIAGSCSYGREVNNQFSLVVKNGATGTSTSLKVTSLSGGVVYEGAGILSGALKISK